jgi:hypothetical protein
MFEDLKLKYKMARMTTEAYMNKFEQDTAGEAPVKALVMLFVIAILAGALLPTAINAVLAGKNSSGTWSVSETATYGVISILIIIAVVLLIVRIATE